MDTDRIASTLVVPTTPAELLAGGFLARYPARTRSQYRIHLRHWFEWTAATGLDPLQAQRAHIEMWGRHLSEDLDRKPRTVAAKLNTICGFYKFAHLDGHLAHDPGAHVRRPKIDFVSTTEALTRSELADLLVTAEADGPVSHAMVCLLGLNGLRIGELLDLDVEHLSMQRGYRTITLPNRKGGKVATLSLAVRTAWAVEQCVAGRVSGPVLLGRDGTRLSPPAARRRLRRLCKTAGIKSVTPHGLRHSFVTLALDAGVPERDIIDSTSHSDTRMLRYYDRNRGGIERNATHAVAAFVGAA